MIEEGVRVRTSNLTDGKGNALKLARGGLMRGKGHSPPRANLSALSRRRRTRYVHHSEEKACQNTVKNMKQFSALTFELF